MLIVTKYFYTFYPKFAFFVTFAKKTDYTHKNHNYFLCFIGQQLKK